VQIRRVRLEEFQLLFADDEPGRPASRALAEAKLAEIDTQMASLAAATSYGFEGHLALAQDLRPVRTGNAGCVPCALPP
jgi:hypothetical protein